MNTSDSEELLVFKLHYSSEEATNKNVDDIRELVDILKVAWTRKAVACIHV